MPAISQNVNTLLIRELSGLIERHGVFIRSFDDRTIIGRADHTTELEITGSPNEDDRIPLKLITGESKLELEKTLGRVPAPVRQVLISHLATFVANTFEIPLDGCNN